MGFEKEKDKRVEMEMSLLLSTSALNEYATFWWTNFIL